MPATAGGLFLAERDALAGERELDFLSRLVDAPLDRRERDLERVRDLRVREADHVAQQERHLQVDVQLSDRAPDGVDRLHALERRVHDLERRDVLERDEVPRPALGSRGARRARGSSSPGRARS